MFQHIGRFSASHPWIVCAAWVVLGASLAFLAPNWDSSTQDDDVRFLPQRCPSVRAYQILEKAFPQDVFASRLIFAVEREDNPLNGEDMRLVNGMVSDLEKLREEAPELKIGRITSHKDGLIGSRLTSKDRQCTLIQVSLGTPFLALQTQSTVNQASDVLKKRLDESGLENLHLYATGQAGIGRDLVKACGDSLHDTTLATIILVVVVLLLVYRSPLLALVPLLTIAISVWVALNILAMMTLLPGVHLVNISKIFAVVILYGAGTDYCLFLICRYREELENGKSTIDAIRHGTGSVGGALTASAGTVMCGLGLMALAEFAKVRYSGPGIALSLAVALLASLTLTPALLSIFGRLVFWPLAAPAPARPRLGPDPRHGPLGKGIWDMISRKVMARPALIWSVSVLLLLPLALLGSQVTPDYRATSQLNPSSESLQGFHVLQKHFTPGETGPLTVLLVSTQDWESPEGKRQIDHLSRGFARLENVAEVRSFTQPLGSPLPDEESRPTGLGMLTNLIKSIRPGLMDGLLGKARKVAREYYISELPSTEEDQTAKEHVTRLDVILASDPFGPESLETMNMIQTWLNNELPGSGLSTKPVRSEIYGVMVSAQDLASVTESDRWRVNTLISAGIFLILLLIVRNPVMAAYLLVTVLFSYYATLGATMLAGLVWSGEILYQLDWRVMFFLFTILVAVGEDYNILLVSRAVQEQKRHGTEEGMRRALARTGWTITSCGLIMAGTFATLMLTNLGSLLQIGFALAFGVLVDTFLVRPFLVPAFSILLCRWRKQNGLPKGRDQQSDSMEKVPPALRMVG